VQQGDTISVCRSPRRHRLTARPSTVGHKWFKAISRTRAGRDDSLIDFAGAGGSSAGAGEQAEMISRRRLGYPTENRLRALSEDRGSVGAYLMVDMAHSPAWSRWRASSPLPHANVVTTTTHKLGGPRRRMVLSTDPEIGRDQLGGFTGLRAAPLIARHRRQAVGVRQSAASWLQDLLQAGGSEERAHARADAGRARPSRCLGLAPTTHLDACRLRPRKGQGQAREASLEARRHHGNKNGIPFDPEKPMINLGVRPGHAGGHPRAVRPSNEGSARCERGSAR